MQQRQARRMTTELGPARACIRALAERAPGPPTRDVRAAVRGFVRRHRRDRDHLRRVLRSVGASSTLAPALLGLGAQPAGGVLPRYGALTGADNPLNGQDFADFSRPTLASLDGDGYLDAVAGETDPLLNHERG
jgi:hypothetical protein